MIDKEKEYWIFVKPHIYVKNNESSMLLYNTIDGEYLETNNNNFMSMVKEIHLKQNLGVIPLDSMYLTDNLCYELITRAINQNILGYTEVDAAKNKPVVLLPILSLQHDVDKLKENNTSTIGENILFYLTKVNLFINGQCKLSCEDCESYYAQTTFCTQKKGSNTFLSLEQIESILSQSINASVSRINISGGNILLHPNWIKLGQLLDKYDFNYYFYIHYLNVQNGLLLLVIRKWKLEILVTFPHNKVFLLKQIKQYQDNENITFHFIVQDENQYNIVNEIITDQNLNNYVITPHYTKSGYDFFKKNVFLEKEDIFSQTIIQREIFCNQKLNSNNFGILNILPDGNVKANINEEVIGNIYTNNLLEIIYKELKDNTSWRRIRYSKSCKNCFYQFLCPPPSNYELVIGHPLCTIKSH